MSRWLLAPVDRRCEIWKSYKVQRIVVDAPDEGEARQQVAKRAAFSGSTFSPLAGPCPISCRKVDEMPRPAAGHEGMNRLSPTRGG
jgi:hypothetical protein